MHCKILRKRTIMYLNLTQLNSNLHKKQNETNLMRSKTLSTVHFSNNSVKRKYTAESTMP